MGRYKAYPEYTSSAVDWLGEVPSSWDVSRLAYVFTKANAGDVIDKTYWGDGNELLYTCNRTPLKSDYSEFPEEKRTESNDLLLTRNGTPYVHKPISGSIYSNVVQRITLKNDFDRDYLMYCLGNSAKNLKGYGVSIESLNFENWKSLSFAYPDKSEQLKVVSFLDYETAKIDFLIEKQRQLIKLLKEKRQAMISHAVTKGLNPNAPMRDSGVEWLGEVPEHWKITRLKYQVEMLPGYAFKSTGFVDSSEEINLLRGINISPGKVRWDETVYWPNNSNDDLTEYELREKDLVLGMDRPWVGGGLRLAMISSDDLPAYVVQRVARILGVRGVSQEYLFYLLSAPGFSSYFDPITTGVSVPHISTDQIGEYYFALPPRAERREIVEFIELNTSKFKKLVDGAERAVILMQERRKALISAAVTGKIDVRDWQAPEPTDNQNKEVAA